MKIEDIKKIDVTPTTILWVKVEEANEKEIEQIHEQCGAILREIRRNANAPVPLMVTNEKFEITTLTKEDVLTLLKLFPEENAKT